MEKPRQLDPNPSISLEEVSGAHFGEPMMWLASRIVDSVTVDGIRLVYVDKIGRGVDETLHIECIAEDESSHTFVFNPQQDGPVEHFLTKAS